MESKTITFMIVLILFSIISSLKLKTKEGVEFPSIEECNKLGKYWFMFRCHTKLGLNQECTGRYHNACEDGMFCQFSWSNFRSTCVLCEGLGHRIGIFNFKCRDYLKKKSGWGQEDWRWKQVENIKKINFVFS